MPLKPRKHPLRNVAYSLWGPTCTILARANTRCRGRPHQQPKDCLVCFASSGDLPVRQWYTICVRGMTSHCVLLLSQEQITPDVQAQLHQLPLEF